MHILHPYKTWITFLALRNLSPSSFLWLKNYNPLLTIRKTLCLWSKVTQFYFACISLVETYSTSVFSLFAVVPQVWRHTDSFRSFEFEICISRSNHLSAKCYCCSCERHARWRDSMWDMNIRKIRELHTDKRVSCLL